MYCIIVRNRVKPGSEERYKSIITENAQASVTNEPECYRFDVVQAQESPQDFYLYEIYQDQQALQVHKQTQHYLDSRKLLADLVVETSVIRADVIATNPNNKE
ncbi:antibiotic biosynthesis monooxygenase [Vibrio sp. SCSIO 43135]|uniref:putative quinol monooxygenase n=1 Tax=Vibrio sp. SCSIO 43135 TaxID=2819096 RepID=UPI0020753282|nr:putative quinol monooxygenase [Vibrio sp. SCSIO 43135]USD43826.1 antibiotic biosynthesis monooxygenase [Vibrio sp. SCSIO 43135]